MMTGSSDKQTLFSQLLASRYWSLFMSLLPVACLIGIIVYQNKALDISRKAAIDIGRFLELNSAFDSRNLSDIQQQADRQVFVQLMSLYRNVQEEWRHQDKITNDIQRQEDKAERAQQWMNMSQDKNLQRAHEVLLAREYLERERNQTELKYQHDLEIDRQKRQDQVLDNCIRDLSAILLMPNFTLTNPKMAHIVRSQVFMAVRTLDGKRKGQLVLFLHGANLITHGRDSLDLVTAKLDDIDMSFRNRDPPFLGLKEEEFTLDRIVLTGALLRRASFNIRSLTHANFDQAQLSAASFVQCDLTHASFVNANLADTKFFQTITTGANFTGAHLRGSDISENQLRAAVSIRGAKLNIEWKNSENYNRITNGNGESGTMNGWINTQNDFIVEKISDDEDSRYNGEKYRFVAKTYRDNATMSQRIFNSDGRFDVWQDNALLKWHFEADCGLFERSNKSDEFTASAFFHLYYYDTEYALIHYEDLGSISKGKLKHLSTMINGVPHTYSYLLSLIFIKETELKGKNDTIRLGFCDNIKLTAEHV